MPRGQASAIGTERVSPNGYHYTKTTGGWELTHRLTAEKKLGRKLEANERVRFANGNKKHYSDPNNIEVYTAKERSNSARAAKLRARIAELQAELDELEEED